MQPTLRLRWHLIVIFSGLFFAQWLPLWLAGLMLVLGIIMTSIEGRWWWFCLGISIAYGAWWPHWAEEEDQLREYHHQSKIFTGIIDQWPQHRTSTQTAIIKTTEPGIGRFLLSGPTKSHWQYGQTVTVTGTLRPPTNFDPDFDYRDYLARYQVYSIMRHPKEIIVGENQSPWLPAIALRTWFEKNLAQVLPRPNRELAAGVLIGVKSELPEPVKTNFKNAGLQHLIVVSGSNVVLLIAAATWLFQRFGPRLNALISGSLLFVFIFITGADPPVLRAGFLGLVMIVTTCGGQFVDSRNALLLAGVVLGILNPAMIQGDVSFWLSFAATAGIILGLPIYQHLSQSWFIWEPLKILFGVGLVAQIAVMPILIMTFGTFPWIGFLTNLIAEPLIPVTMATSLLTGLTGGLPEFLAKILALPAFVSTSWLSLIANVFGPLPLLVLPAWVGKILSIIWAAVALYLMQRKTLTWQPVSLSMPALK